FGYAGTGKTTLARHFAEGVDGNVSFGTFTGKAASVLHKKGVPNAQTLHSLIYKPKERSRSTLRALEDELLKLLTSLGERGLTKEEIDAYPQVMKVRSMLAAEKRQSSRPFFELNLDSSLRAAKLLVVDEVSMVDETM